MSDTIQSGPPNGSDDDEELIDEPAPTAAAMAAAFVDLEEKILHQLGRNHDAHMRADRDRQDELLAAYQNAWSQQISHLSELIASFSNGFSRDVSELQDTTHRHAREIQRLSAENERMSKQVHALEVWRSSEAAKTKGANGDYDPDGR